MSVVTLAIIGAGDRGTVYANWVLANPNRAKVVAVAEPRSSYREKIAREHNIPAERVFKDWKELAKADRLADAAVVATMDSLHVEPAIAFAKSGYSILLEKPMAPTEEGCRRIATAVAASKVIFAVCHVLRYTPYTKKLKAILDSGVIGDVVAVQHLEGVEYYHQAHSFVRGNWRNEKESTFMLLSKSCHDMDWIRYIVGKRCLQVSSFGGLHLFKKENQPRGASDRCLSCTIEPQCPYSAVKIYLKKAQAGNFEWPVKIITDDLTCEGVTKALREGPYGRCVYTCDNDVVDHQVVNLRFEGGQTASFMMTAFTKAQFGGRQTIICGTHGQIYGDSRIISVTDFLTDSTEKFDMYGDIAIDKDHGGGDGALMDSFISAVMHKDQSRILSGLEETLESHLVVFAAETSRMQSCVVPIT